MASNAPSAFCVRFTLFTLQVLVSLTFIHFPSDSVCLHNTSTEVGLLSLKSSSLSASQRNTMHQVLTAGMAGNMIDPGLLDKIDKLFACGVGDHIPLPQLVVVGDQSRWART